MKTIEELYTQYNVMLQLREHMYKVASVASFICDHFKGTIDRKSIISTCLLHDIGKIVEIQSFLADSVKPEGEEHWKEIQKSMIAKYKTIDEHVASLAIAVEIGASLRTLELLHSIGFRKSISVNESKEFEKMICLYADMRVSPTGIVSLKERCEEMADRYANQVRAIKDNNREDIHQALESIEKKIFENMDIKPENITEESCKPIIPSLATISPIA